MKFFALLLMLSTYCYAQVSPGSANYRFQYLTGILTSASPITIPPAPAWNAAAPPKYYTMAITATTASAFQINLEGSIDQLSWQTLKTASTVGTSSLTTPTPSLYFRLRASTINAADSITATAIGVW